MRARKTRQASSSSFNLGLVPGWRRRPLSVALGWISSRGSRRSSSGRSAVPRRRRRVGSVSTVGLSVTRPRGLLGLIRGIGGLLTVSRTGRLVVESGLALALTGCRAVPPAVLTGGRRPARWRRRSHGTAGTSAGLLVLGIVGGINSSKHQFGALEWNGLAM